MANPEHLAILKQGVEKWNEWREESGAVPDLSDSDLSELDLSHADFSQGNLSGSQLHRANLFLTNLSSANLTETDASLAHFLETNLADAIIGKSYFFEAIITDANLSGAILSGLDLSRATIRNAVLTGAQVSDICLRETILSNVDLSGVIGIEKIIHYGPSSLDPATLERSGALPPVFLRGVGLSDTFIDYIPSLFGKGIEFYSAFLSHNSADKEFVRRLYNSLQGHGVRCWLDEKQLLPGDDIYDEIDHGIRLWDKLILVCSENSLQSWWVEHEWKKAMDKEQRLRKERGEKVLAIIPVDIDGFIHSDECKVSVKSEILSRKVADFTNWKDHDCFERGLEGLVAALRADEGKKVPPPEGKL